MHNAEAEKEFKFILPDGIFKQVWNLGMLLILLVSAIYIPIIICFFTEITPFQQNFNFFIDLIFISDFFMNFLTAYDEKGRLVTDLSKIRNNYIFGWALLDVLTMAPY